jgi:hypothetical protein
MKSGLKMIFFAGLLICSCHSGITSENRRKFILHKEFIKKLSFSGYINDRKYCDKCGPDKYQVVIDLYELFPKDIDTALKEFKPYYIFNDKNQLVLCVTKEIYESALKGLVTKKLLNSDNLIIVGYNYSFLSREEDKWLIGG